MKIHLHPLPFAGIKALLAGCWPRVILLFLLFCGSASTALAQTILWDKTIGGNKEDFLTSMEQTPDGGFILGGNSYSGISGEKSEAAVGNWSDYWLVKLNPDRSIAWDKTYGSNSFDVLQTIRQTPDGGYILAGYSSSGKRGAKSQASKGKFDYWLVKVNANGIKVWDKSFGGSDVDYLTSLQITLDGGFILGGYSRSGISGDKSAASKGNYDYWIIKLKADGTKEWDKTIGGAGIDELTSLAQTSDGGYILGGSSESGISGDKSEERRSDCEDYKCKTDYWVVKLKADGTKVWDKTFGGDRADILKSVLQTNNGDYILAGESYSNRTGDKSEPNRGYDTDYWLVKLNANGTKVWDKAYGGYHPDYFSSVTKTQDGGYLLGGYSYSDKSVDKSENGKGSSDYWVVKIKANGRKEWDKTIGGPGGDKLNALAQLNNGSFLLGGYSAIDNNEIGGDKSEPGRDESNAHAGDFWIVNIKEAAPLSPAWDKRFGGTGSESFTTVIQTSDGGYLSGGYSNSGISGDKTQRSRGKHDFWIVKSDRYGRRLWDKRYGGPGDDYLNSIIQTDDGGYLLAGSSLSGIGGDKTEPSRGDRDFWIVKVDSLGNKQWDKRYGGSGYDELKKVKQYCCDQYILAGSSNSPSGGDKTKGSQGGQDYWIIMIDNAGKKLWDRRYGGALNDALEDLVFTNDMGFLLAGSSASGISGDKSQVNRGEDDFWVIRIDQYGTKIWDKSYGGTATDNLMKIEYVLDFPNEYIYLAGHSTSGKSGEKSQPSQGGKDFWLLKIDGKGQKVFDKRYGGSQDEGLRSVLFTKDGGLLLAGRSESDISGDRSQPSWGGNDYWLVKTNSNGEVEADQRYGGSGNDELRTVLPTSDGGFLLAGRSNSGISGDRSQPRQGSSDYWLVKAAPITSVGKIAAREATLVEAPKLEKDFHPLTAYPNPFKEKITIRFTLSQTQTATVKIYDSQGREISTLFNGEAQANQTYQVEWRSGNKSTGLYFLQLQTPTLRQEQKLVLTR